MDTLTRDSNLLNDSILSTSQLDDLDRDSTILQDPWENDQSIQNSVFGSKIEQVDFNQAAGSLLESIYEVALDVINFVGSLFEELNDCFYELSQTVQTAINPTKEQPELSKTEDQKVKQFWNNLKLDPKLVKRDFSQIDRQSLMTKLFPILGNPTTTSLLGRAMLECGSYDNAIGYLISKAQANHITADEFYAIVDAIKSELYSEVK